MMGWQPDYHNPEFQAMERNFNKRNRQYRYMIRQIKIIIAMAVTIIILIGILLAGGYVAKNYSIEDATAKGQNNSFGGTTYTYTIGD